MPYTLSKTIRQRSVPQSYVRYGWGPVFFQGLCNDGLFFLMRDTQIILAIVLLPVPREVEVDVL